jgi:hypothetical protein
MALKKEALQKIATLLKLDEAALTKAITDAGEVDLPIGEFTVFTTEELTARDEQKISDGKKEGQKAGETIGKEIVVKEIKKQFGVEFEGKELPKLVEVVKTQLSKGDEGLKEQIKLLQKSVEEKDVAIATEKTKAEGALFDAALLSELPANRSKMLTDQEYLIAIKANLEFTTEGVKKGGQILRDAKTQGPIERKAAIDSYFTERKWVEDNSGTPGGRGGGNEGGKGKPTKYSEVVKQWEAEGKGIATAEFQQHLNSIVKENPEFSLAD